MLPQSLLLDVAPDHTPLQIGAVAGGAVIVLIGVILLIRYKRNKKS